MAAGVVHAKFNDRVIFATEKIITAKETDHGIWNITEGLWSNHPVFGRKNIKETIEFLRGKDSDV